MTYALRKFSDYAPDVLAGLLRKFGGEGGSLVSMSVQAAEMPSDAIDVRFLPDMEIQFSVPMKFASEERRDFFTNRWMACWPMFAATKERHPDLIGTCRLWLDDLPKGPGLTFCGNAVSHILVPDSFYFGTDGYESLRTYCDRNPIGWTERAGKVFWRGSSTGLRSLLRVSAWQELPRFRLCLRVKEVTDKHLFDVALSQVVQIWDRAELAEIEQSGLVSNDVPIFEFMQYKYSIDVDGNTCSWPGLFTKLVMAVTVIKVDSEIGYRQWYYDRLIPWKNFVPLSATMSELPELAAWLEGNPQEAEAIARRGHELANDLCFANVLDDAVARVHSYVSR